jgi:hypothetical protein
MAFTHSHINAFVIVGGDSDFITLVEKLKQYDRKVFVVGGRSFTSQVMQKNCTVFVAYEDILGVTTRGRQAGGRTRAVTDSAAAMPLIRRALKLLADREVTPQLGLLKSTLLQQLDRVSRSGCTAPTPSATSSRSWPRPDTSR